MTTSDYLYKFFGLVTAAAGVVIVASVCSQYGRLSERKRLGVTDTSDVNNAFGGDDDFVIKDGNIYQKVSTK